MRTIAVLTLLGITLCGAGCGGNKAGNAANNAAQTAGSAAGAMGNAAKGAMGAMGAKPNCGAVEAVWVNTRTHVYHEPGDPAYGHTAHGMYMCPSAAVAKGYHAAGGAAAGHHKHHKRGESTM